MRTAITGWGTAGIKIRNVEILGMNEIAMDFYGCSELEFDNVKLRKKRRRPF